MRTEPTQQQELLSKLITKPELICRIEQRLAEDDRLGINIGMEEGLILQSLCTQKSVDKVVEIGTQYGCSAAWMASALGSKGTIYTFEKDPDSVEQAKRTFADPDFLSFGCQVQLFAGDALDNLSQTEDETPFDLIFIDANKSGYYQYFQWAKRHIRTGGLIVIDNVYLFGAMFFDQCPEQTPLKMWNAMGETLVDAFKDPEFTSSIIPTHEGLLISTKKSI